MKIHPSVIVRSYFKALDLIKAHLDKITRKIDINNEEEVLEIVQSSLATKFTTR
jgi:T-complex protein 1 subunit gamma